VDGERNGGYWPRSREPKSDLNGDRTGSEPGREKATTLPPHNASAVAEPASTF
jgi:hypothetical protein